MSAIALMNGRSAAEVENPRYNAGMVATSDKVRHLQHILQDIGRVAVAFSGGTDSTFLLAFAHETPRVETIGITVSTPLVPEEDLAFTRTFCEGRGIRHIVLEADALACDDVRLNPPDRCYHCKRIAMGDIVEAASAFDAVVCDGSNVDDAGDYRPGMRATSELGIESPLAQAGFTKSEIREEARKLNLPNWNKPASACLASRIPYGTPLDAETLTKIGKAEAFLHNEGFPQVRVRVHDNGTVARIEVPPEQIAQLCADQLRDRIIDQLRKLGFAYVSCDLQGYRMGSLNELL